MVQYSYYWAHLDSVQTILCWRACIANLSWNHELLHRARFVGDQGRVRRQGREGGAMLETKMSKQWGRRVESSSGCVRQANLEGCLGKRVKTIRVTEVTHVPSSVLHMHDRPHME
ncbi:hypothetical protein BD309DRAFT_950261 [Dichomitus squalens]|nr:hypothetical protein BD309DRAFT_950261 [Dichomitus squalens]